jgi:hypothetical protein
VIPAGTLNWTVRVELPDAGEMLEATADVTGPDPSPARCSDIWTFAASIDVTGKFVPASWTITPGDADGGVVGLDSVTGLGGATTLKLLVEERISGPVVIVSVRGPKPAPELTVTFAVRHMGEFTVIAPTVTPVPRFTCVAP